MDSYSEGLHVVLAILREHANAYDRTTQDAINDLQILQDGYRQEDPQ